MDYKFCSGCGVEGALSMLRLCLIPAFVLVGCARGAEGEATLRPSQPPGGSLGGTTGDAGGSGEQPDAEATGGTSPATGGGAGMAGSDPTGGAGGGMGGSMTGGSGGTDGGACVPAPVGCTPQTSIFTNPSFEQPALSSAVQIVASDMVNGWTAESAASPGTVIGVEIWRNDNSFGITPQDGNQHVETSSSERTHLWQEVATIPHSLLRWSFYHRARGSEDMDRLELWIGAPSSLSRQGEAVTGPTWTRYEGTYSVPAGQTLTRFEFRAIVPVMGSGNHLDLVDAEQQCPADADQDGCVDNP